MRILRPVGASRYEIYHDALAAPILDWRSRRQDQQRRARDRRRTKILAMVALTCAIVAAGVTVLALAALRARDDAQRQDGTGGEPISCDPVGMPAVWVSVA